MLPWLLGIVPFTLALECTVFLIITFSIFDRDVKLPYIPKFFPQLSLIIAIIRCTQFYNSYSFGLTRDDLFILKENLSTPYDFFLVGVGIYTILSRKHTLLGVCSLSIWLMIYLLTLSRSVIVLILLSVFVFRGINKYFIGLTLSMLLIVVLRITGDMSVFSVMSYLGGEAVNIGLGVSLNVPISIRYVDVLGPLLSLFPGLGSAFGVSSIPIEYNELLKQRYGLYGLAFGILGVLKYYSYAQGLITLLLLYILRIISRTLEPNLRELLKFLMIINISTIFRWSITDYISLNFRIYLILFLYGILKRIVHENSRIGRRAGESVVSAK